MRRALGAALVASVVAVLAAACDDSSNPNGGVPGSGDACSAYTSCGTCTPVQGCGWCFNASGGGCAASPDECAGASEFTWTWDPSGCPGVDASVSPLDAGGTADTGATPEAASEASSPDAGATEASLPESSQAEASTSDGASEAANAADSASQD